ncbi:GNAT family N-acetyltransferase [Clostridium ihumii]|uniref:GNAT family N-acetyltransferase n=1 Tax=Clostridium ihumii TaxID=1470356 RepID=UPI0005582343|nr:GNAT family N-acetyltransferase [Clostridium ihumii]
MRIRSINIDEVDKYSKISMVDSEAFKDSLLLDINDDIVKLKWCYVLEDEGKFIGRIVGGSFDDNFQILRINIYERRDDIREKFLKYVIDDVKSQGYDSVEAHLYSDNVQFKNYKNMFLNVGFKITQEKYSYLWDKSNIREVKSLSKGLNFKTLKEVGEKEYVKAIEAVTENTLDRDDIENVKTLGKEAAAQRYFNELKEIDFNEEWWKLAYKNEKLVGLIIPQKFNDKYGAINYIGVVKNERGKGYVDDLLTMGSKTLSEAGIQKIIGDIDVNNFPMENSLKRQGYKLSCNMRVLKLEM